MLKHFRIEELVPPETHQQRGDQSWHLIDRTAAGILDQLRLAYGPLTVNDWLWGGNYTMSGFRPPGTDVGADLSQHRFGRAFDVKPSDTTVQHMYADILDNMAMWRDLGLTVLEDVHHTPTWLHFDARWTGQDGIVVVQP